ncbi:ABC transporter permease subunit [Thermodesulforhabdus norvegica]|uniref:Putative glutamine transport system permease protein GlnP n=1 Tax=Thermodesulforhabdus norvegica TaxID=39841 RepID=A0A1I4SQ53_9BACT|nr:ABC transporter permease subunit [Thermodesulforhabdus norvegica]SFM66511.1 amino acid ABC transporter membrane protein, PAAT family [Thermodesulforhabdus norvegica]
MMRHSYRQRYPHYRLWVVVFWIGMALIVGLLYFATVQIEYVWRWYRIPQYFFYKASVEVRADGDGDVVEISPDGEVIVEGPEGKETYRLGKKAKILVNEGDHVFAGDVLGRYTEWKIGIMLMGLIMTLKVSIVSIILGIIIGLITGLARISDNPACRWSAIVYIELIRGSPLLVQIFIWYFVLGTLINTLLARQGLAQLPPLYYGVAALAFFSGAYIAEIVRAGIQSIHRGQMEAARSLGMTYAQAMRYVILPQAFRRILPPLAGQFISLIKDSSLLGIIAIRELTKATREIVTSSLQPFELWFLCAALYLVLTFGLSMVMQYLERRFIVT